MQTAALRKIVEYPGLREILCQWFLLETPMKAFPFARAEVDSIHLYHLRLEYLLGFAEVALAMIVEAGRLIERFETL